MPEIICFKTYHEFRKEGLLNAEKIIKAGWDKLVETLDRGSYVRLDFKTADKLLEVMKNLKENYNGDLNKLHNIAINSIDLEKKLKGLGKGIGDVTVNIFLRELRGIWKKANPLPQELVILTARNLGLTKLPGKTQIERARILLELQEFWRTNEIKGKSFADFEAALLRLGKDFCRKNKCAKCELAKHCVKK
ncbi:MAG: hypothetical protein HY929_03620 [Euryarchaeota archaeon]|nr:hypothetical protein [Euryarchaeota archaeon]